MRKLLMASAAILGATGTLAFAQPAQPLPVAAPSQGQFAGPYGAGPAANNNNNAWGIANTPTGSAAAGPLSGSIYSPNVNAVPAPGTIVIRLNGRVEVDIVANFTSVDKGVNPNGTFNGYKLNPVGVGSYLRLYPGFDGVAANGLRYGASAEIRENFSGGVSNGNNGAQGAAGTATSPSSNSSQQTLLVRRAFTYLASDRVGLVRIGQGDGVLGLFDNCIFTSQCWDAGVGSFNGGGPTQSIPSGPVPPFVWLAQAGVEYSNSKIVYLTPQFYGFDFGVQYAPNQGNAFQNEGLGVNCIQAGPSCISVSSGNDATRWINQTAVGLRWQQAFGAVDVKTYGFWETSGKENLTTQPYQTPAQARGAVAPPPGTPAGAIGSQFQRYDDLSFYKFGAAVTAFNFTLASDYIGGAVNGQLNMRPTGGVSMNAVVTGLTYANGPITAGLEWGVINSQGDARLTGVSQRREYEIAAGGAYRLAPGVQLVGEYEYMQRHQGGFDFATGTLGVNGRTNNARAQGVVFSTVLTW
jgi:Gram-negative porin